MRLVPLQRPAHISPTAPRFSPLVDFPSVKATNLSSKRLPPGFPTIIRCVVGVVFLLAGALKVADPARFYSDLLGYEVALPDFMFRVIAVAFPWLEVLCGGALLANRWIETVGFLVVVICLIFVGMLGQAVARGLDLNCGCFGATSAGWFNHPSAALGRAMLLLCGSIWWFLKITAARSDDIIPAAAASHPAASLR